MQNHCSLTHLSFWHIWFFIVLAAPHLYTVEKQQYMYKVIYNPVCTKKPLLQCALLGDAQGGAVKHTLSVASLPASETTLL